MKGYECLSEALASAKGHIPLFTSSLLGVHPVGLTSHGLQASPGVNLRYPTEQENRMKHRAHAVLFG